MSRNGLKDLTGCFVLLGDLLLGQGGCDRTQQISDLAAHHGQEEFGRLWDLATSHHVIMRVFPHLQGMLGTHEAHEDGWAEWLATAIAAERMRIDHALGFLADICRALEDAGDTVVIKSLDHWPDLGNDLDLYSNAPAADVVAIMHERFRARLAQPSWGDRLAFKRNFIVPGLPELVEVHLGRLGQTGEQKAITHSLVAHTIQTRFGGHTFRVPAAEDQMMISTLQRMYRHLYLRLCDLADTARLVDVAALDYNYLWSLARSAGLLEGLNCYLGIVAEYVKLLGGRTLRLPSQPEKAMQPNVANICFRRKFLRVPVFPQAASFYAREWMTLLCNGDLQNTLRLTLLPGLALAAVLASKATGNDKGIW